MHVIRPRHNWSIPELYKTTHKLPELHLNLRFVLLPNPSCPSVKLYLVEVINLCGLSGLWPTRCLHLAKAILPPHLHHLPGNTLLYGAALPPGLVTAFFPPTDTCESFLHSREQGTSLPMLSQSIFCGSKFLRLYSSDPQGGEVSLTGQSLCPCPSCISSFSSKP